MICSKCKLENTEESKFCSECGSPLQNEVENKIAKNNRRNKVLIGIFSAVIGITVGVAIYFFVNNPLNKFEKAVQEYEFAVARDIYSSKIKGDKGKEQSAKAFLVDELQHLKQQFKDEEISYKIVIERLNAVEKMGVVNQQVATARKEINALNNSRIAFLQGKELLASSNFADALIQFNMVKEVDANYKEAQELIVESGKLYKNDILKNAENYAVKEDYESAVSIINDALLVLNKDSDLTAKYNIYEEQLKVQEKERQEKERQEQERQERERQERERQEQERQEIERQETVRQQQETQIALKEKELKYALAEIRHKQKQYPTHTQEYRDALNEEINIIQKLMDLNNQKINELEATAGR